jgi:FAD/FMN-containing dehydrogenase
LIVAAEVSVFPDPSDRLTAVLIFFGVEEDGAGTGAATFGGRDVAGAAMEGMGGAVAIAATADSRALGGEALGFGEIAPVFGGSSVSAGKRETNSSLAPAFAIDVWLKSLGRLSPSFWMFSLVAFSALMKGGSAGKTTAADTAR